VRAYWLRSLQVGVIVLLELDGVEKQFMPQMQGLLDWSLFDWRFEKPKPMEFSSIPPTSEPESEPALVQTKLEEMLSSSKTGVLLPDPADLLYWLVSHRLGSKNHKRRKGL